jgi:hypothetical protein
VMVDVFWIEQRHEEVDVEECGHTC